MSKIDLTYYEQQTIHYAKGWFQKTDLIEDLKQIVMKEYDLSYEHVKPYSISHFVVNLFQKLELNNEKFLLSLFDFIDSKIDYKDLIEKMISKISEIPVLNNDGSKRFELAKPDYTLLPELRDVVYRVEADTHNHPLEVTYLEDEINESIEKYNKWKLNDNIFNIVLYKVVNNEKIEFYKDGQWLKWNNWTIKEERRQLNDK